MSDKTGGPAFPSLGPNAAGTWFSSSSGVTVRDWFAGHALQVMAMQAAESGGMWPNKADAASIATAAYAIADALLTERAKP